MIIVILTRAITGACAFETRQSITNVTVIMVFWDATVTVREKISFFDVLITNDLEFVVLPRIVALHLSLCNLTGFLGLHSTLTKTNTSGSGTMSPSKRLRCPSYKESTKRG